MVADVAELIRTRISGLSFMDKHAGVVRAATFVQEDPNVEGKYIRKVFPVACDTTKDECLKGAWRDLVPNTKYKSVSYFEDDGASFLKKDGNQIWFKARLRYVCWLNLPLMGKTSCSISSAIVASIIGAMPDQPFNSGNFTRIKITPVGEAPKNAAIFAKYTYDESSLQYLLGPYDYFSLLFEVEYAIDKRCLDTYEIGDPELCDTQQDNDTSPEPPLLSFCERVMQCDSIQDLVDRIEEIEDADEALTCATLSTCNTFQQLAQRVSDVEVYDTDDIEEGGNLYYTQARFDSAFAAKNTDQLAEGITNLYFTTARSRQSISGAAPIQYNNSTGVISWIGDTDDVPEGTNLYWTQARFNTAFAAKSTSDLTEGSNLYYTDGRADARINLQKGAANGITPLDGTGKISSVYLPAIAITDTSVVGSQAAMLALTAQTGDVAVRTDLNKSYILAGTNPAVLGDWQELLTPTDAVLSVNGFTGAVNLTTTNIAEGTNLYYTQGRFDSAFAAKSTTDLSEGTNLYYTASRFDTAFGLKSTTDLSEGTNLYYTQARFDTAFGAKSTSNLSEGSNLYYTDARARASISDTVLGLTYTSETGVLSIDAGYFIPTTALLDASYFKQNGNAFGGAAVIGTTDAQALSFIANTTERARFLSTGEFLIGYNTLALAEVFGVQKNQNAATYGVVTNTTSGTAARALLIVSNSATLSEPVSLESLSALYTTSGIRVANAAVLASGKTAGFNIGTTNAVSLKFWTNNTEKIEVSSGGFIGVGTAAVTNAPITSSFTLNGVSVSRFINLSSGAAASSSIAVRNDANNDAFVLVRSSAFTTSGLVVANQCQFIGGSAGIVSVLYGTISSGDSIFIRGGSTAADEVARISSTGLQTANSKTIGINTAAVANQPITSTLAFNGNSVSTFVNTSSGNAAISNINVTNGTYGSNMRIYGSSYATAGLLIADLSEYQSGNNMLIRAAGSAGFSIKFATGGTAAANLRLTIDDTSLTLADTINLIFNTGTGSKIGTAVTQKFAFWNKTPIVQPSSANQAALTNSTGGAYDGTLVDVTTASIADPAKINANFTDMWTLQNEMRNVLVNLGLMKGAA